MKRNSPLSTIPPDALRCAYSSSQGHRCRMPAVPDSRFCLSHAKLAHLDASELATELTSVAGSLESPEEVHRLLAKVALAVVAGRMSARKAAVLGYLGQMLLRSHREIAFQKKFTAEAAEAAQAAEKIAEQKASWQRTMDHLGSLHRRDELPISNDLPGPATEKTAVPPGTGFPEGMASSVPDRSEDSQASTLAGAASAVSPYALTAPPPSSTSSSTSSPPPPKPPDLNHFYPRDPTLAPGLQDPNRLTFSPPDRAVLARRNLRFNRMHGYRK